MKSVALLLVLQFLALDHLAPAMARSYLIFALRDAWEQSAVQRSLDKSSI